MSKERVGALEPNHLALEVCEDCLMCGLRTWDNYRVIDVTDGKRPVRSSSLSPYKFRTIP